MEQSMDVIKTTTNVMSYYQFSKCRFPVCRQVVFLLTLIFVSLATLVYADEPLEASVGLKIHQITSINQREENFTVVATLIMKWHEPSLELDSKGNGSPKMYEGSQFINLMADRELLWPAISFFNAQNRINYQNRIVLVEPSGNVTYHARFTATFQAPDFDFRHFPLDNQKFSIILDSIRPLQQVQFKELEGYSQMGETLGEEEWVTGNAKVEITEHTELLKESSRFIFAFHGERHLNYYLVRILLPTIIIILVSWFTFFLKDYGKRIDLASGNLLLFIAFNFTIGNDLPRLGYLTLMDTFLISTFVITGLVALANVVLKRMERHGKTDMINRIDTFGVWGYPIFYFGAGVLMFLIFRLSP